MVDFTPEQKKNIVKNSRKFFLWLNGGIVVIVIVIVIIKFL